MRATREFHDLGQSLWLDNITHDLIEWDYGGFEGKLASGILEERPDWELDRDDCPNGEAPGDVAARADRFLARI